MYNNFDHNTFKEKTMKKAIKKVFSLALMTAMLATAVIGAVPASAKTYDNTFTVTINGTNCSTLSNNVVLYTNDTDTVRVIKSTDYRADNFRYSKIMIFNKDGRLIEAGGDLTHVDGVNGSAQEYINIPTRGFAIAFNPGVTNLKKCFDVAMEGAVLYNATMSVIHEVIGSYSGKTLTIKYDNATAAPATAKKFLFVGNSSTYFNGTPIKFKGLAQSAGVDVDVTYCTYGSAFLYEYANAGHERGKAFRNHLKTGNFDYVVLQDGGTADYSDSKPAVSVLLPLIKESGAEALLYMRYSSNSDPAQRFMSARKHYINYTRLSREYGLNVSPAATSFLICTDKYPEINLYATDNSHHSKEGSYLIACTWLYSYLGIDPVGVEYDADLGADVARKLQECAKIACEEEYDYKVSEEDLLPDEDIYYVNGNKYESITINKPYTTNGTAYSGTWTEHNEDGSLIGKYTNGIYADDNGSSSAIGCVKGAKINVDIDLKGKYDIKAFRTQLYGNPGWGIPNPFDTEKNIYVEFSVSNDGKNYTLVGKADAVKAFDDGDWTKAIYTLEPKEKTEARYIRATFYNTGFLWCDEISAYGVEGGNIALNKDYTVSGVGERKDSYCAKLNDGIASEKLEYGKGEASTWFGFYYHTAYTDVNAPDQLGTVTYDFEKTHTIDKVRVHTLFGNTSGIKSPQYISVEVSDDGKTFTEVAKNTYSPSSETSVEWADLTFAKPVDARFVRVCVKLDGTFSFINEIEIYGEEKVEGGTDDDDEVIEGENLALGKDYTTHSPLDGYNAKLTDGVKSDKMAYDGDVWFAFKCHPADSSGNTGGNRFGTVTIDLGAIYDISGVNINTIYNDASGISICYGANVYLSDDGESWSSAYQLNVPDESELYANAVYTVGGSVKGSARFVKIEAYLGAKSFLFIDEIEIFGKEKQADDDDEFTLGDVNGNGEIEKYDYIAVKRAVMNTLTLDETQQKAADVNGKDGVEKYDYILIKRHVMKTYVIGE